MIAARQAESTCRQPSRSVRSPASTLSTSRSTSSQPSSVKVWPRLPSSSTTARKRRYSTSRYAGAPADPDPTLPLGRRQSVWPLHPDQRGRGGGGQCCVLEHGVGARGDVLEHAQQEAASAQPAAQAQQRGEASGGCVAGLAGIREHRDGGCVVGSSRRHVEQCVLEPRSCRRPVRVRDVGEVLDAVDAHAVGPVHPPLLAATWITALSPAGSPVVHGPDTTSADPAHRAAGW